MFKLNTEREPVHMCIYVEHASIGTMARIVKKIYDKKKVELVKHTKQKPLKHNQT